MSVKKPSIDNLRNKKCSLRRPIIPYNCMLLQGWHVFAGVRRAADADTAKAAHSSITPLMLDVTDEDSVAVAAKQVSIIPTPLRTAET